MIRARTRLTALAGGVVLCSAQVAVATPTQAEDGHALGSLWYDGLDTRLAAQRFGQALDTAGYVDHTDSNGRSADDAWTDGLDAAVWGIFSHANAGGMAVQATETNKQWLFAGTPLDVVSTFANARLLTEYLPAVDVDDMRLAVFAGCYTARTSAEFGDLDAVATDRGVDAVVTYQEKILSPASEPGTPAGGDTNYSGNYYWSRASGYLADGVSVENSLKRALTDLIQKEGSGAGYQSYRLAGAVPSPGSVKIVPAGPGSTEIPAPSTGIEAYSSLFDLTEVRTARDMLAGESLDVVTTREGVDYRLRRDGSVYDVVAQAALSGPIETSFDEARAVAKAFAAHHVSGFRDGSWRLVATAPNTTHVDGSVLASFAWRTVTENGVLGSQVLLAEVDRRTGAMTYLAHPKVTPETTSFVISRADAIEAARAEAPVRSMVVSVRREVWDRAYWRVRLSAPAPAPAVGASRRPASPERDVLVDAATGEAVRVAAS